MRGWLISFSVCFIMIGCNTGGDVESKTAELHSPVSSKIESYGKKPMKWEITLIDERDGSLESLLLNDFGYFSSSTQLDKQQLVDYAAQLASGIDEPMMNPSIDLEGNIVEGRNRTILSEAELVEMLMNLHYFDKEITLPIYETEPSLTAADLKGITDVVIGSYQTSFNPYVTGRSMNIKLSSDAIQHYVLAPEDVFSFNKVVGERTVERGYQEAKEIVNEEFVMGIGGGICQTSSTLFNAVDKAGLEIVERYTHSREIGYVPANRDATVSWGGPDFKFKNSYSFPVLIKTNVSLEQGVIAVDVLAAKPVEELVVSQ
ncbi:VanW family protein [Alkalihalobacillus sp. LMS39]|uniref:VanW family protein n=1 Tax=Alkalihalobacillus sp. LMS39 TaxID=2924032 RepID=UPI001FB2FF23|nr:VanW family protein [Alkalihalobacillus sp. LMS39]UOE92399.1 VanW family protein [Alkalihalobacillus sp. LMS39]